LPAGRAAIHQDESHLAPANALCVARFANKRQESSTAGVCIKGSLRSLLASKSSDSDRDCFADGVKPQQPSAVALLAGLEAIDAHLRTEGRSPGVMPDEAKFSVTDGATLRRVVPTILKMVAHFLLR
jgi:hypothetical protein